MALLLAVLLSLSTLSSVTAIPLGDFYPFGAASGDSFVGPTDDGSSEIITLNRVFPFYGRDNFIIVVNNNGLISFEHAVSAFTPQPFPLNGTEAGTIQLVAPYWGDVDTRAGGNVWYRETTDQADRDRAQREIRRAFPRQASRFSPRLVFIATWDDVGYFNLHNDKTNTFQCILASDGFMSYVIFLYADGLIQWTTGDASGGLEGLGGIQAQVGFNAGDGENFASHTFSQTADVINIANSSIPEGKSEEGMLVYRVDGRVINEEGCVDSTEAELVFTPPVGNQLGGTPVLISGLCFQPGDILLCAFDGRNSPSRGEMMDSSTVLCTTPVMTTLGTLPVIVRRFRPMGTPRRIDVTSDSAFATVSPIRGHQVGFSVESSSEEMQLYFKPNDIITLTWLPRELVPSYLTDDFEDLQVTVELHQQISFVQSGTLNWIFIDGSRVTGHANSGSAQYTIPQGLGLQDCGDGNQLLCPVAFKLSATVSRQGGGTSVVALWSAVGYLQSDTATENDLIELCSGWFKPELPAENSENEILASTLRKLTMCPPTLAQATADNRFRREVMESALSDVPSGYTKAAMKFYFPDASICYLEVIMKGSGQDAGMQCCYNDSGIIVTGQLSGGSADKMSPLVDFNTHNMEDLLPFAFCCRSGSTLSACDQYNMLRPSRLLTAEPYELPVPACTFGDPHIVTLDGHKYTFNGKGEFTLVETHDATFTLQGRMEQALNSSNTGTVFTAIVAHQAGSLAGVTVEFQRSGLGDVEVLVNQRRLNFADMLEHNFQQVVVTDRGNNTVVAEFSGGSNIEIRVQNNIISVMLVTLPNRYRSLTRGLMGNYNRNTRDDFIPKGSTASIPMDSSVEEIFNFGKTWMITDPSESLFSYARPEESFLIFQDVDFTPTFVPVFDNPELEREANRICGNDEFCKFDIAATKSTDIGMSTMMDVREFDTIVELAMPIVCVPPCGNGVCVATNSCSCSSGFAGETCTERLESECEVNMCRNNGTCVQHVRSFTCTCPQGFIGIFCQEREPPFSLKLFNSSPRTSGTDITVEFLPSKQLSFARCNLFQSEAVDCSSGRVKFSDVSPGSHRLVISARANTGERAVERMTVFVCDEDAGSCGVNLINEGVTVTRDCARIQFASCGMVDSYRCKLNDGAFTPCRSPVQHCGLEVRRHRLQVLPEGAECRQKGRLSINFDII